MPTTERAVRRERRPHPRTTARLCSVTAVQRMTNPLPEPLIDLVAQRFRVLGEPMRIKLLDALREQDATVGALQEALGASQQNVSKHLGILHQAGMVRRTKQGTSVVYSIADPLVFDLCDQVCGGIRRQVAGLESALDQSA
jgi:DNA-binding transcriptional ArsR family regulator